MAASKVKLFSGLKPRLPESLLPEGAATIAQNCDFAYGELRNTKAGFALNTMLNNPKSIYTDDGLAFYTWSVDVNAVRSPIANDQFNRMYYTGDNGFKVANRLGQRATGGVPSSSYLVGVPRPTVAPSLAVQPASDVSSVNADIVFKFHYEYGGIKYQEQVISPAMINNTQFGFTPPSASGLTPSQAFPVVRMTANWKADSSQVFDIYTDNSTFQGTGGLYSLSVAKDTSGSTYTLTLTTGIKESDKEARAYVFTYVNSYGEEGPPSDPALVTTSPVINVNVTITKDSVSGYAPITQARVYRTPTGSTIANYFYVGTVAIGGNPGQFTFTDNVKAEMLNEELLSLNYYPPSQALTGLMALPNGILCAWKGNELHFSEAYKPWAWPPAYVKPLPNAITGGIPAGSGAVITTAAQPYMLSGVSPDSMTATRLNVDQAGVSKWSIAVLNGQVVYASNDGIVTINGAQGSLAQSQQFFTREVWRSLYSLGLSSMRFAVWDGRLVVFSSDNLFTPFMVRFDEADGTMTELPNLLASCAFISQLSDQFYYGYGNQLYQFNGGIEQSAVWQSREVVIPKPLNFGIAQALVTGTWVLELWAYVKNPATGVWGYQLKHTQNLTDGLTNFRLPSGYESDRYRLKLTGKGRFRELTLAQTARELATV
jgi:hypothetical protein